MKIVKADAKGRVTGFTPGQIYSVVDEEPREEWVKIYPEKITPEMIGTVVGVYAVSATTLDPGSSYGTKEGVWGTLEEYSSYAGRGLEVRLKGNPGTFHQNASGATTPRINHLWVNSRYVE